MKYLAAYCLLALGGNENPDAAAIKKLLGTVSATVDDARLNEAVNALKGKKLEDVIANGLKKVSNVSFGGSAGGASSAPAPAAATKAPVKEEPKKEEKQPEKKEEEEDYDMGDLFG